MTQEDDSPVGPQQDQEIMEDDPEINYNNMAPTGNDNDDPGYLGYSDDLDPEEAVIRIEVDHDQESRSSRPATAGARVASRLSRAKLSRSSMSHRTSLDSDEETVDSSVLITEVPGNRVPTVADDGQVSTAYMLHNIGYFELRRVKGL